MVWDAEGVQETDDTIVEELFQGIDEDDNTKKRSRSKSKSKKDKKKSKRSSSSTSKDSSDSGSSSTSSSEDRFDSLLFDNTKLTSFLQALCTHMRVWFK